MMMMVMMVVMMMMINDANDNSYPNEWLHLVILLKEDMYF